MQKVKKTKVLNKIPKADVIIENVNETKQFILLFGYNVTVISIDYKIERYWARLQLSWRGLIINTIDKLIKTINKVIWKRIKYKATLVTKEHK